MSRAVPVTPVTPSYQQLPFKIDASHPPLCTSTCFPNVFCALVGLQRGALRGAGGAAAKPKNRWRRRGGHHSPQGRPTQEPAEEAGAKTQAHHPPQGRPTQEPAEEEGARLVTTATPSGPYKVGQKVWQMYLPPFVVRRCTPGRPCCGDGGRWRTGAVVRQSAAEQPEKTDPARFRNASEKTPRPSL